MCLLGLSSFCFQLCRLCWWSVAYSGFPLCWEPWKGSRTIRCGQLIADNLSQTIRRRQFVVKYNINFIESTASISATFFSSIPLPLQQHSFHHSCFHFSYTFFINPASIFATFFSSLSLQLHQHSFRQSRFHFSNILFINPASISAIFVSSHPLPLPQNSFYQSSFHFINILFINPASISATLSCLQVYLLQDFIIW